MPVHATKKQRPKEGLRALDWTFVSQVQKFILHSLGGFRVVADGVHVLELIAEPTGGSVHIAPGTRMKMLSLERATKALEEEIFFLGSATWVRPMATRGDSGKYDLYAGDRGSA